MNAQEAIEKIEKRLNESRMNVAAYGADKDRDPFTLELLENKNDALSIVLESARLLHSVKIDASTTNSNDDIVIKIFVSESHLKEIGINLDD